MPESCHIGSDVAEHMAAREIGDRGISAKRINSGPIDTDPNPAGGPAATPVSPRGQRARD